MNNLPMSMVISLIAVTFSTTQAAEDELKILNLSTVNTEANEMDPHPSSDKKKLFFSTDTNGKWDVFYTARRSTSRPWVKPQKLGQAVETKVDDRSTFITADNRFPQYLYFATHKDETQKNFDIYAAQRISNGRPFSSPTPIFKIATAADELHPWLTPSGRHLFFSRKTDDGWRVLYASRQATTGAGGFGEPKLIESIPAGFRHPTLTPDGKQMFLEGPAEEDRWGIFVTKFDGSKWSRPLPLNINQDKSEVGERSPCLTRDGDWLYFASDREGTKGKMDIWIVPTSHLKTKSQE